MTSAAQYTVSVLLKAEAQQYKTELAQAGQAITTLNINIEGLNTTARSSAQALDAATQAQARQQSAAQNFLGSLREQIATYGKNTDELLRYRAAQLGVGQEASSLILQFQNQRAAQASAAQAAQAEAQAQREAAQAKQAQTSAQASFLAGLRDQVAVQGLSTADTLRYRAAQLGVTQEASGLIASLSSVNKAHGAGAMSAAQHAQALRMLPMQFTDIATSVASGMPLWMVAVQQGGQIKDSFGGAGVAARELGRYVLGLANPFALTAVAAAVMAAGAYAGAQESRALQSAIIASGNAAGVTQGQLMGMAAGVDDLVGTQGRAVEVLSAFVETGKVGAANMQDFTTAAIRFESVGGAAAEDTAKSFAELGKAPVEASLKLNESMGYLTASTYQQIKALMDQGKHTQAAEIAQKAFADTLNSRASQMEANLGLVEKGWYGIKNAVAEAWDAIKSIGRDAGPEGRLETLGKTIAQLEANIAARKRDGHAVPERDAMLESLRNEQALLQKQVESSRAQSTEQANQVQLAKDLAEWEKRGEAFKSDQQKLNAAIEKERQTSQGLINAGMLTEQQLAQRIAAIRDEYAKKAAKGLSAGDSELANVTARVAVEQRNLELLRTQGVQADKLNDGERLALQLAEQLNGKLDARTRASKEAQLVQAQALAGVLKLQDAERKLLQTKSAAAALDDRLTNQQIAQYAQSIEQLISSNEQMRVEIDLVGKDVAAQREYLAVKAQEVVTAKELEVINLRSAGVRQDVIDKAEQELRLLRDKATLSGRINSTQDGQAAKDMLDSIERETLALSQTNEQRQVAIALRELENKGIKAGSAAYAEYIPKIKAAIANKAATEQAIAFWGSVEGVARDAWNNIGNDGESAAQRIERALKAGVWDMLWQITGRRWLIDLGASMGVPGAALAQSQAGSGIFGTAANAASLYNAGSALYGMGGVASSAGIISGATYGTAAGSAQSIMLAGQEIGGSIGSAMIAGAESASSVLSVAFDPITLGIGALVAVLASMDDSGTPHIGGSAIADSVTGIKEIESALIGFSLSASDVSEKVVNSSKQLAGSVLSILQGFDKLSGGKSNFSVATGYAEDTSRDPSFAAFRIMRDGQKLVDWQDTQTSSWAPKRFADGEEGVKQYGNAIAASVKQAIDQIELPDWAANVVKKLGDSPSMDELSAAMATIQAMPEQALQAIGTSSQALSGIIYTGMQAADPAGAGAAFAGQITYGIEASLYSGFSGQIEGIISTQLVTPIVTAMASGATLTEAIATASVDAMKAQVAAAGAAFAAIVSDPGFQEALSSVNTLIADTVGSSVEGLTAPTAPAAYTGQATAAAAASTATTGLSNAVDQLRQKAESAVDSLTSTGADLAVQLLRAQGDEEAALFAERKTYLAQYVELDAAEQGRIAQLYDQNQIIRDQIGALEKQKEAAEKLKSAMADMLSTADSTADRFLSGSTLEAFRLDRLAQQLNESLGSELSGAILGGLGVSDIRAAVLDFVNSNAAPEAASAVMSIGAALIDLKTAAQDATAALDGERMLAFRSALLGVIDLAAAQTDAALIAHEKSLDKDRKAAEVSRSASQSLVQDTKTVFDALQAAVDRLFGSVSSTQSLMAVQGRQYIKDALSTAQTTGALPDSVGLNRAISAATAGLDATQYTSQAESDFARLVLANELKDLQNISGDQLTEAERMLNVAQDQLTSIDAQRAAMSEQIDVMRGVAEATGTTATSTARLLELMETEAALRRAAAASTLLGSGSAGYNLGTQTGTTATGQYFSQADARAAAAPRMNTGNALDALALYSGALDSGFSMPQLEKIYGLTPGTLDAEVSKIEAALGYTLPRFERGGDHSGGVRVVGERGWEVEATGPARYWNQSQLGQALLRSGGQGQPDVVAELRALREQGAAQARAMVAALKQIERLQKRWEREGMPATRNETGSPIAEVLVL